MLEADINKMRARLTGLLFYLVDVNFGKARALLDPSVDVCVSQQFWSDPCRCDNMVKNC